MGSDTWDQLRSEDGCFFIAEIGVNHNGSVETARELIDVASSAGADAVKFQTFFAEELVTTSAKKAAYQARNTGADGTQFEMLKALELDADSHRQLKKHCEDRQIMFLSTPFSARAADMLLDVGVDAYKVGSGDLTHPAFLRDLAARQKPMILSTGMGTLAEVAKAVATILPTNEELALLHCVSNYPASPQDCNLKAMATLESAFRLPVGWSDHTQGDAISVAAAALGASIIEKHFTLDRTSEGPDHLASLEPDELRKLVSKVRDVSSAMGTGLKLPTAAELDTASIARRSVVAARDLTAGTVLSEADLQILRPGTGIQPEDVGLLVGMSLAKPVPAGGVMQWTDFKKSGLGTTDT